MTDKLPEVWLRGPVTGIPASLQPVAHALLQAREEVEAIVQHFPEQKLWDRPGGVASVGFHLQHFSGVLSRLFTYARGESLDAAQREALAAEQEPSRPSVSVQGLVQTFRQQVDRAIDELRGIDEKTLTEPRFVGRNKLPSTKLGLIAHAAEHTQRHVGQLLVTARVQMPWEKP
jgi:uncharacterized damage-inducible protein DinB